jgi:hypothetical protein
MPPIESEHLLFALSDTINDIELCQGEDVGAEIVEGRAGPIATIIRKIPNIGLAQFWLINAEVSLFITLQMGSPARAKEEFAEAAQIVKDIHFRDGDGYIDGKKMV